MMEVLQKPEPVVSRWNRSCNAVHLLDQAQISSRFNAKRFIKAKTLHGGFPYCHDLIGHWGCVNAISFSNGEGKWLCSGSDDKRVLLWNVLGKKGEAPFKVLNAHQSNVFCTIFSPDNRHVISCANDSLVVRYDLEVAQPKIGNGTEKFTGHAAAVYKLSFLDNNVFMSASEDHFVLLWDTRASNRRPQSFIHSNKNGYNSVEASPVSNLFVTANTSEGVQLWDTRHAIGNGVSRITKPLLRYSPVSVDRKRKYWDVSSASFNKTGTQILTTVRKCSPVLYNVNDPNPVCMFDDQGYRNFSTLKSCCFGGYDHEFIFSGSDDFRIYMWVIPDLQNLQPPRIIVLPKTASWQEPFDSCDNTTHGGDGDGSLGMKGSEMEWMVDTETETPYPVVKKAHRIMIDHRSIVNNIRAHPTLPLIASSGVEKCIKFWTPFPECEEDEEPRVKQPRRVNFWDNPSAMQTIFNQLTQHDAQDDDCTTAESEKTLLLFDYFNHLERTAEGAASTHDILDLWSSDVDSDGDGDDDDDEFSEDDDDEDMEEVGDGGINSTENGTAGVGGVRNADSSSDDSDGDDGDGDNGKESGEQNDMCT